MTHSSWRGAGQPPKSVPKSHQIEYFRRSCRGGREVCAGFSCETSSDKVEENA